MFFEDSWTHTSFFFFSFVIPSPVNYKLNFLSFLFENTRPLFNHNSPSPSLFVWICNRVTSLRDVISCHFLKKFFGSIFFYSFPIQPDFVLGVPVYTKTIPHISSLKDVDMGFTVEDLSLFYLRESTTKGCQPSYIRKDYPIWGYNGFRFVTIGLLFLLL